MRFPTNHAAAMVVRRGIHDHARYSAFDQDSQLLVEKVGVVCLARSSIKLVNVERMNAVHAWYCGTVDTPPEAKRLFCIQELYQTFPSHSPSMKHPGRDQLHITLQTELFRGEISYFSLSSSLFCRSRCVGVSDLQREVT